MHTTFGLALGAHFDRRWTRPCPRSWRWYESVVRPSSATELNHDRMVEVRPFSILDAMSDCLAVVDERCVVRYLNAAWRRFDGDDEYFRIGGDFVGACASRFEAGSERDALAHAPREIVAGRSQRLELECSWRVARGGLRHGAATITPCEVATEPGALIQLVDITERTNADAAVRESEARYRCLVDGSPDIVFITDRASRMIYANRALEEQTGYSAADFQMRQPENPFLHPADAQRPRSRSNAAASRPIGSRSSCAITASACPSPTARTCSIATFRATITSAEWGSDSRSVARSSSSTVASSPPSSQATEEPA